MADFEKTINEKIFEKPSCKFKYLQSEGFKTPNYYEVTTLEEILEIYNLYVQEKRDELNYEIDGLVEEINDFEVQKELGYEPNGLNPKFAKAIKFDSIAKITKLLDIDWTVGGTGKVVPTAVVEPVDIMGITISRASMHNYSYLQDYIAKGLGKKSEVVIARKGDVIPQVIGVKTKGEELEIPSTCPSCGTELRVFSVDLVCENLDCPAKVLALFMNFFNTLKIKGVSEKFIEKAMEKFNIKTIKDLMNLTEEDILSLDGFAEKSAKKTYELIHSVKEVTPQQFMALLNIPNQGVRIFENLFEELNFETFMEKVKKDELELEDIASIKGFGEKSAQILIEGLKYNLERLKENSKFFEIKIPQKASNKLNGKTFCITGKMNTRPRKEFEQMIKDNGGKVTSVNEKLNYLVTNEPESTSSKMKKALKINTERFKNGDENLIQIIDENELIKILEGDS